MILISNRIGLNTKRTKTSENVERREAPLEGKLLVSIVSKRNAVYLPIFRQASSSLSDGKSSSPPKVSFSDASKDPSSSKPDRNVQDFFSAIEEEQPTMFNPSTNR
jgi:hypothetical protein